MKVNDPKKVLLISEKDRPNLGDQSISFCLKKIIENNTDLEVITQQFSVYVKGKIAADSKCISVERKNSEIKSFAIKEIRELVPLELQKIAKILGTLRRLLLNVLR